MTPAASLDVSLAITGPGGVGAITVDKELFDTDPVNAP